MVELLIQMIITASMYPATTYGFSELMCGDVGKPRRCEYGAITASGEIFDPETPSAAIPAPFFLPMRAVTIGMRLRGGNGKCVGIRVNDKANPRYIGVRGFDLSPAAVTALGGNSGTTWGGRVELCEVKR